MQAAETHDPGGTDKQPTAAADDLPELGDLPDKWSDEVIWTRSTTYRWGTYEFEIEIWHYTGDRINMTIELPDSRPIDACWRDIICDWIDDDHYGHSVAAATLLDAADVTLEEVRD